MMCAQWLKEKVGADQDKRLSRVMVGQNVANITDRFFCISAKRQEVNSGVESPSRCILKVANSLLSPVDPLHQVLYVPETRVAPLVPLWAFQVEVVLVGGGW